MPILGKNLLKIKNLPLWNQQSNGNVSLTYFAQLSRNMRFRTMWYARPTKAQTSLRICAVWSEPLLLAWILYDCLATEWTQFGVSKLKGKQHRLVWVYTCQNTTLLEITCCGSNDDSRLIWTYFRARSNLISKAFIWEKNLKKFIFSNS